MTAIYSQLTGAFIKTVPEHEAQTYLDNHPSCMYIEQDDYEDTQELDFNARPPHFFRAGGTDPW